jgi:uncharacterized protein YraI
MYLRPERDISHFDNATLKMNIMFIGILLILFFIGEIYLQLIFSKRMSYIGEEYHPSSNIINLSMGLLARYVQILLAYIFGLGIGLMLAFGFFNKLIRHLVYQSNLEDHSISDALEYSRLDNKSYQNNLLIIGFISVCVGVIVMFIEGVDFERNGWFDHPIIIAMTIILVFEWYYQYKKANLFSDGYKNGIRLYTHPINTLSVSSQLASTIIILYISFNYIVPSLVNYDNKIYSDFLNQIQSLHIDQDQYEMIREDRKKALATFEESIITLSSIFYYISNSPQWNNQVGKATVSSLNVRNIPSVNSDVIDQISNDRNYQIVNQHSNWSKIKTANNFGWVSSNYLDIEVVEPTIHKSHLIQTLLKALIIILISFIIIPIFINITALNFLITAIITIAGSLFTEWIQSIALLYFPHLSTKTAVLFIIGVIASLIITLLLTKSYKYVNYK